MGNFRCNTSKIQNEMRFPALSVRYYFYNHGNDNNHQYKSPTNPQRGENPYPTPCNDSAQFQYDKCDSQQTTESDAALVYSFVFHLHKPFWF